MFRYALPDYPARGVNLRGMTDYNVDIYCGSEVIGELDPIDVHRGERPGVHGQEALKRSRGGSTARLGSCSGSSGLPATRRAGIDRGHRLRHRRLRRRRGRRVRALTCDSVGLTPGPCRGFDRRIGLAGGVRSVLNRHRLPFYDLDSAIDLHVAGRGSNQAPTEHGAGREHGDRSRDHPPPTPRARVPSRG